MVQFIPRTRGTFGEQMAQSLGAGASAVANQYGQLAQQLALEKHKQQQFSNLLGKFGGEEMTPQQMMLIGKSNPELIPFLSQIVKSKTTRDIEESKRLDAERAEIIKKEEEQAPVRESLDWLDENLKYTGSTGFPGLFAGNTENFLGQIPNTEAYEKRQEFTNTGWWVTDKVYTHFNKGVISDKKLKIIQEELAPRGDLFQSKNKARIAALRRLYNLPKNISSAAFDKQLEREVKAVKKIPSPEGQELPPLESFFE